MAIPKEAYKELEEALGPENVSQDPGIIETYSHQNGLGSGITGPWWVRPAAVVLPGGTQDAVRVVEICNKYKLKFKAHSTAWIVSAMAQSKNCVLMDMRRMNQIDIRPDEGYMITEPYATAGESQVEAMKLGYTPHLVGAGPNASNLASATSMQGTGGMSVRTSMNERNPGSIEWVLPSGEVLHLGSLDTPNAGWFCGDGPGPSLRGMMRGAAGNIGGNGVFTRIAVKLYPWYGVPYLAGGTPPFFTSNELPNTYLRLVSWKTTDDEREALYRLGEAEILDYSNRWSAASMRSAAAVTSEEYMRMRDEDAFGKEFPNGYWNFFIHAASKRQLDYSVKVLEKIVKETNGVSMDPRDLGHAIYEIAMQNAMKSTWIGKSAYMPTGANTGVPPLSYETIDQCFKFALQETIKIKREWIKGQKIYDDGEDNAYACLDENGHYLHVEHAAHVDHWEKKAEPWGLIVKGLAVSLEKGLSPTYMSLPGNYREHQRLHNYLARIQDLIDPNRVGDSLLYRLYSKFKMDEAS